MTSSPSIPPVDEWKSRAKHGFMAPVMFDMAEIVSELNLWEWFRTEKPKKGIGYMWMEHDNLTRITNHPKFDGGVHSGSSYAWTLRQIQSIAINGFEEWDKI